MVFLVGRFLNIIATSVFSFCYYLVYIAPFKISKDVQNRIDALQDFQTLSSYLEQGISIRSINHLMDLATSTLQLAIHQGGSTHYVIYLTFLLVIVFDLNFKDFFTKKYSFYLIKILTLLCLLIPPFGFGLWEHHTVFVVIAMVTIITRIIKLNYYLILLLAVILDPLAIMFFYFKSRLSNKSRKPLFIQISSVIALLITIVMANTFSIPSSKFQTVSLLIVIMAGYHIILNKFIMLHTQIEILLFLIVIFIGVSFGWTPTNRLFMDYLIFLPIFVIVAFKVKPERPFAVELPEKAFFPIKFT